MDLSSDHTPVLLYLSSTVILKKKKQNLTNKATDWESFRELLHETINLQVSLNTSQELDFQTENFISQLQDAAKKSTPEPKEKPIYEICYPVEIRDLIKERRKKKRIWHRSRNLLDKRNFNKTSCKVNEIIKNYKQQCLENYLQNLGPGVDKDYSLRKATRRFKRPLTQIPPIKDSN